nr:uncharacterized protein LOC123282846 [Equus asinus]
MGLGERASGCGGLCPSARRRRAEPQCSAVGENREEEMRAPGHAGWSPGTWAPAPFWRPLWDLWIPELWKGAHPPELGARRVSPGCSWHGWGVQGQSRVQEWGAECWPTPADLAVSDATPASLSQERTMKSLEAEGRGDEEGTAGGCRARWGRHRPLEGGRVAASGGTTSGRGKRCPRRRGFGGSHSPRTRSTFRERQVRGTERRPSCGARPAPRTRARRPRPSLPLLCGSCRAGCGGDKRRPRAAASGAGSALALRLLRAWPCRPSAAPCGPAGKAARPGLADPLSVQWLKWT